VLAADACDRAGLELAAVDAGAEDELRAQGHGAGTSVANPVEIGIGPATPPPTLSAVITTILDRQPFSDVLVHVNVAAYYGYGTAGVAPLLPVIEQLGALADTGRARLALVVRNLDCAPAVDVEAVAGACRRAQLPRHRDLDEAAVAIAAGQGSAGARDEAR